jgi:hypothetical protein
MPSSKMDFIVATLMLDGHYKDSVFLLPFSYCKGISIAFGSYVSYKKVETSRDAGSIP